MFLKVLLVIVILISAAPAGAQESENDRAMNRPVEPFRIIGNIYYVGASDVTSYLIATPQGHILIDAGFKETVPQIKANIAKLGFQLEDIKILLINHAHYDHCGGLAEIKKLTGARLLASPPDAPVLEDGGMSDFRFGGKTLFTPVKVDEILKDSQEIKLGDTALKTHFTFGHTKGATSWTMDVSENARKYKAAFVASLTTLDYSFLNNSKYPQITEDFSQTFKKLARIKADIFLSSHGGFFDLTGKAEKLRAGSGKTNPFIDPKGYQSFVARMSKAFQDKLKVETAGQKNKSPKQ